MSLSRNQGREAARAIGLALAAILFAATACMGAEPERSPMPPAKTPFAELKPQVVLKVGDSADWVLVSANAVWTGSTGPNAVHRIDPRTNTIVASVALPGEPCAGLAEGFGALWVPLCGAQPGLARIALASNRLEEVLPIGPPGAEGGIATSADSVWLVTDIHGSLARIDPATGKLRQTVRLPAGSFNLRHADGTLYATRVEGAELTAVDAATGKVLSSVRTGTHPRFLTIGGGYVWTLNQLDGTMTRISVKTRKAAGSIALHAPGPGGDIAFGEGKVWTTVFNTPLSVTDAATGHLLHQWTGPGGDSLGIGHGAIWITDYNRGTIARIPLSETGIP